MHKLTRREFLKSAGLAAGSFMVPPLVFGRQKHASKPNIIVIMSDEHNAGILGCCGNDIVRTPNLDGLGRNGVTLEGCYCNSPLCVPSRLSFTSGKYASRVGAWNNRCWLPAADYPSLPRLLNAAGYESFLCGKMHYDRPRRYGFTEIGGNMNNHDKTGEGKRREADNLKPKDGISNRFDDFHTGNDSKILKHDSKVTAATVDFLNNRRATEKPFFMLVGYLAPHFPLIVPQKYWQHYEGKVPMPEIPEGHRRQRILWPQYCLRQCDDSYG